MGQDVDEGLSAAEEQLRQILARDPTSSNALGVLARVLCARVQRESAMRREPGKILEALFRLSPGSLRL